VTGSRSSPPRNCSFVVEALLAEHDRVGLSVDSWNAPAIAAYRRLGFQMRGLAAARIG
jgi:ribosomal protein S18 acetylase RimI-like enzyme